MLEEPQGEPLPIFITIPSTSDDIIQKPLSVYDVIPSPDTSDVTPLPTSNNSTITFDSDFTLSPSESSVITDYIDIESILKKDLIGRALLQKGLKNILNNSDRDKISDILVAKLLNTFNGKLTQQQFNTIAQNLVKIIPGEKKTTYFIPPIKKKDSLRNKSEPARGKLVEKYRNKLHLIRSLENSRDVPDNAGPSVEPIGKYMYIYNMYYLYLLFFDRQL